MRIYLSALLAIFHSASALCETITIQPGNCIVSGNNQICAQKSDCERGAPHSRHVCRFGVYRDAEFTGLRSHQLVELVPRQDGTYTEVPIRNFGSATGAKADCEADARARSAAVK